MVRRTAAQSKIDDNAFPIRVKIARLPEALWAALGEIRRWLDVEVGEGNHAGHGTH